MVVDFDLDGLARDDSIHIVSDFYNLRIVPNLSDSEEPTLNGNDWQSVKCFLNHYLGYIAIVPGRQIQIDSAFSNTDTALEAYQQKTGTAWYDSKDCEEFAKVYLKACQTIDDLVADKYHESIEKWLGNLRADLEEVVTRSKLEHDKSPLINPFYMKPIGANVQADLEGYRKMSDLQYVGCNLVDYTHIWCGLPMTHIGVALYRGISHILMKEVSIKKCAYPHCGQIFVVSRRGESHKHCSAKCRERENRRPYYEQLASYIAEWLKDKPIRLEYGHRAEEFDDENNDFEESLAAFVRRKHGVDFSLPFPRASIEFDPKRLNPYLKKYRLRCRIEDELDKHSYFFERVE